MKDYFDEFRSEKKKISKLGEVTNHPVKLVRWEETNNFLNYDGSMRNEIPGYSNPTPELLCTFLSAEGRGGIVHRFRGCDFYKYEEFSKKQVEYGKIYDIDGYACIKKDEDFVRIISVEKTRICTRILNEFFHAFGLPSGSGIYDLENVIKEGRIALATVKAIEYNGKKYMKIQKLRKAAVNVRQ